MIRILTAIAVILGIMPLWADTIPTPRLPELPDFPETRQDSLARDSVANLPDTITPAKPARRVPKTASPVDIDDQKREPVLHYYDKHGEPLAEPVLFLATLDTVTKPKSKPEYPLYNGVSVGVNFADAIMMAFGQRYASFDVHADVSLFNWFFPVVEAGIGYANSNPDNKNYIYKVKPSFYGKIGFNYNFLYKSNPAYQLFLGFRAAMSHFDWELADVRISADYWGETATPPMKGLKSTVGWGELLAGIKVKIAGNFSLGWSVRWHFPFNKGEAKCAPSQGYADYALSRPWYVPGYGGNGAIAFTFSAIWNIPERQKTQESLEEL